MVKSVFRIMASLLFFFWVAPYVWAGVVHPDLGARLSALDPSDEVSVIVVLADRADLDGIRSKTKEKKKLRSLLIKALKQKAADTQAPVITFLKSQGAKNIRSFWVSNRLAAVVRAEVVWELAGLDGIDQVNPDETVQKPTTRSAPETQASWNVQAIRAPEMWEMGYTGAGVVIAGMDTGVDADHPDLAGNYRGGENSWFDPSGEHSSPYDADGHGTRTMGIMVGGDNSGSAVGVAPGARWIAVKIFDDAGSATYSNIHLGYQWLLDPDNNPDTDDSPDVVNNSWGLQHNYDVCAEEFRTDIQVLKAARIAVVFSAGNAGPYPGTSVSPANYPESLAVGAVSEDFSVSDESSRGPSACDGSIYPELTAPGEGVRTTDLTYGGIVPNSYITVSGTSLSAPHVAGAMALLLGSDYPASVEELETSLILSAADLGESGPDNDYGNGFVDVMEAYVVLGRIQSPACTDADEDGFYSTADCGEPVDCDDTDPSVFPGAIEIKKDFVDQDCNGYDLTIDIIGARYHPRRDAFDVEATSALGSAAELELAGFGPMRWNRARKSWTISVKQSHGNPGTVTVQGVEGSQTAVVR